MWWKSKYFLFGLVTQLLMLTFFVRTEGVKAEKPSDDGFTIEAERVVGSGMFATIVKHETSGENAKPMLRIQYKSATIYGMKLTKQIDSPKGAVTVSLKADGPVTVKDMIVDTTAISFQGACINAAESLPELGMDHVVMIAHYMKSVDSLIEQLSLNTVLGKTDQLKPSQLKILQDLSLLPINQLDTEIEKITNGHLPLLCEDGAQTAVPTDGIGTITDPLQDALDVVNTPLEPITEPLEPVLDTLDKVLEPVEPVIKPLEPVLKPVEPVLKPVEPVLKSVEPVLKPVEPVLNQVEPVLKPLEPVLKPLEPVTKPLEPVVSGTTEVVDKVLQSTCDRMKTANGVITKELALALIDEAIAKKIALDQLCQSDITLMTKLQKMEEGLLKSLGLLELFGKIKPEDPVQQLYKMRDKLAKEKDGAIIYSP